MGVFRPFPGSGGAVSPGARMKGLGGHDQGPFDERVFALPLRMPQDGPREGQKTGEPCSGCWQQVVSQKNHNHDADDKGDQSDPGPPCLQAAKSDTVVLQPSAIRGKPIVI